MRLDLLQSSFGSDAVDVLIIDRPHSWHVRELQRAAGTRQRSTRYRTRNCRYTLTIPVRAHSWLRLFCREAFAIDYDCVLTRAMPASMLEQVVFWMDWLDQIARQYGTLVIDPGRTVEASVDKS